MDPQEFRKTIPLLRNNPDIVYLDSATTTLIPDIVIQRMKEFYEEIGVIPNRGAYDLVLKSNATLNKIRQTIGNYFNVDLNRIAFTTGTSHGSGTAASLANLGKKDRVLFASNLHNSSFLNWFKIVKDKSINFSFLNLNEEGQTSDDDLVENLNRKINGTTIVILDHAPMGTGTVLPVKLFSKLIHESEGSHLFLDATRTAGVIDIDAKREEIDFLVCQGHTGLFGPPGTGILIFPENSFGEPPYIGSGSVESSSKTGYKINIAPYNIEVDGMNIGGLVGLNEGIQIINSIGKAKIKRHITSLQDFLMKELEQRKKLIIYNTDEPLENVGILSFNIRDIYCHDAAFYLNELTKIFVRAGKLCNHLLIDEFSKIKKDGVIQVSFNYYNNKKDIEKFLEVIDNLLNNSF